MAPRRLREVLFLTSSLVPLAFSQVLANPVDGNVAAGAASIAGEGTANLQVHQTSDKAIIDWRSFNIAPGETTRFVQPGVDSVTLNRVVGALGASAIDGTLTANGKIFLVNPDGIAFGMGAIIDTAGLVATTADIANDDFMAGNYAFSRPGRADASVVNLGTITATNSGFAALVAPGVRNAGIIAADLGRVSLASGNSYTLDFYGDQLITLTVGDEIAGEVKDAATGETLDALVKNEGAIRANGGTVYMSAATARKVVDSVINNTGVVEAKSVGRRNGKIVLGAGTASTKTAGAPSQKVKVSGTLSASGKSSGETGGKVQITGEDIELAAATVDASGASGGGTVLVGGDVAGGNPDPDLVKHAKAASEDSDVDTATTTSVDAQSSLDASATDQGDGGKVVVWANGSTDFAGSILAMGGIRSGNGGFAEVSGKQSLSFGGHTNLAAWWGTVGTLLLDPLDMTIGQGGLSTAALEFALSTGDVVVRTGTSGGEGGDIKVLESFGWSGFTRLTLNAFRHVSIGDGVKITNQFGELVLRADAEGNGTGIVDFSPTGSVVLGRTFSQGRYARAFVYYNPPDGFDNPVDYSSHFSGSVVPSGPFGRLGVGYYNSAPVVTYMLVNTPGDLQAIESNYQSNYALGRDIDASETADWNSGAGFIPISDVRVFDGLGHTISNLTINSYQQYGPNPVGNIAIGLFAYNTGYIANVGLVNANITGRASGETYLTPVGGLVGYNVEGAISQSYVTGTVTGGPANFVGGLVGYQHIGNYGYRAILDSYSIATVRGESVRRADGLLIGGIGGLIGGANPNIGPFYLNTSYAAGAVVGTAQAPDVYGGTGGLIGAGHPTFLGTVLSAYWDVNATGQSQSVHGVGLSTEELTSQLPVGFDPTIWGLDPDVNAGYPYLVWQTNQFAPTTVFEPTPLPEPDLIPPDPPTPIPDPAPPPADTSGVPADVFGNHAVAGNFAPFVDWKIANSTPAISSSTGSSAMNSDSAGPATAYRIPNRQDALQLAHDYADPIIMAKGNGLPDNLYIYPGSEDASTSYVSEADRQCVALVKALAAVGSSFAQDGSGWTKAKNADGTAVTIAPATGQYPKLEKGTPIATFEGEVYPGDDGAFEDGTAAHAAIFLSYVDLDSDGVPDGMYMLEQNAGRSDDRNDGQPAWIRFRAFDQTYKLPYSAIQTDSPAT